MNDVANTDKERLFLPKLSLINFQGITAKDMLSANLFLQMETKPKVRGIESDREGMVFFQAI